MKILNKMQLISQNLILLLTVILLEMKIQTLYILSLNILNLKTLTKYSLVIELWIKNMKNYTVALLKK